mmetsp:Transcript_20710/g.57280  ORF Transcript_20710/g.57280 Transcript_20710/m.57280 type:complete len:275 (-) Transcript_20710:413-1237(-)
MPEGPAHCAVVSQPEALHPGAGMLPHRLARLPEVSERPPGSLVLAQGLRRHEEQGGPHTGRAPLAGTAVLEGLDGQLGKKSEGAGLFGEAIGALMHRLRVLRAALARRRVNDNVARPVSHLEALDNPAVGPQLCEVMGPGKAAGGPVHCHQAAAHIVDDNEDPRLGGASRVQAHETVQLTLRPQLSHPLAVGHRLQGGGSHGAGKVEEVPTRGCILVHRARAGTDHEDGEAPHAQPAQDLLVDCEHVDMGELDVLRQLEHPTSKEVPLVCVHVD